MNLEGAQPYHAKPFPIPKVHEQTLKTEINRLVTIGVSKRKHYSEWAAPTFIIPEKKMVQFVSFLMLKSFVKELRGNHFLFLKYRIYRRFQISLLLILKHELVLLY